MKIVFDPRKTVDAAAERRARPRRALLHAHGVPYRTPPPRAPACLPPHAQPKDAAHKPPDLEAFLAVRDYVGAITLLRARQSQQPQSLEWQAYVLFHSGEHDKARARPPHA
jgi:hypothetical protein